MIYILTDHETEVEQAIIAQVELSTLIAELDARYNRRARRPQASSQRDWVLDVHVGLHGECALVVTSQNINGHLGDEIDLRIQAYPPGILALALVRDSTVERLARLPLGPIDGDMQFQIHGQSQADDIEARSDIGARAWRLNDKGIRRGGGHGGLA